MFHNSFILIISIINSVFCSVNIFLDKNETLSLLGVEAELYYVRDGVLNYNALNHILTVPTTINILHFVWESVNSDPIPYEIDIVVNNEKLLRPISINVSKTGRIPTSPETVSFELICTGIEDAAIIVDVNLNITLKRNTFIKFRRKKLCSKDPGKITYDIDHSPVIEGIDSSQLNVFYIILCLGCSFATVLVICFLAYIASSKKETRQEMDDEQQSHLRTNETENRPYVVSTSAVNSGTSTSSNISHSSMRKRKNYTALDNRSLDLHDRIVEITIQRKRIRLHKIELEGTFGRVFNGIYTRKDGFEEDVIVKTVMDFASATQISFLLREGLTMYGLKHKNIMSVLGVSIEDHVEPYIIYLKEGFSNLKKFLQKCTLTTQEVVEIALQIISGIQYMHKKKILHKDLATRNCLIDGLLNIKVADNALARDLFPNDYHCLGDNENRPVKWLAIESLVNRNFSTASDVWSFGVTLWELTTLAQQPYVEVDPFEIEHYLKDGFRLTQPVNCPDELFAVMAYCWAMSPDERPTFSQLHSCLQDFRNQLYKYV